MKKELKKYVIDSAKIFYGLDKLHVKRLAYDYMKWLNTKIFLTREEKTKWLVKTGFVDFVDVLVG